MTASGQTASSRPEVRIAERAGFCWVRLAIDKARRASEAGEEVTTLGQLVHNPGIKADPARHPDSPTATGGGRHLVVRAHGVPREELETLRAKEDIQLVDATCTWLIQSQKAARELNEAGYTVRIIGHENHPEVRGVRSYAGENHVVVDDMDRSTRERVP